MNNALFVASCRALAVAAGLALLTGRPAANANDQQPTEIRLNIAGQSRLFDIAMDEVWVAVGSERKELRKVPVQASRGALASLAHDLEGRSGEQVGLVLHEHGVPRGDGSRALLTRQVVARLAAPVDARALASSVGATQCSPVPTLVGWWVFCAEERDGAPVLAAALAQRPGVLEVYPELARKRQKLFVPDDLFFQFQWHLLNTGQDGATPGMDVAVTNVWQSFRGNGVVIGVIDDGLEYTHPDLKDNVVAGLGYDFVNGDNDPMPDYPEDGHGTCVSGVAAGRGDNSIGVAGAAFMAGLVGEKFLGGYVSDRDEASAFLYENQTISIKNNSWGPTYDFAWVTPLEPLSAAALEQGATVGRGGRGVIYTFASGNSRQEYGNANFTGEANSIYTIAVTGCDDQGGVVSYATPGTCVVIAAPTGDSGRGRQDITTVDRVGTNGYNPPMFGGVDYVDQDYTRTFNGTSSACPLASGVIALLLESNPNLGWRDVQEILMRSARVISTNSPTWQTNSAGFHFNYDFGAGMIQAEGAVSLGRLWTNLKPHTNVVHSISGLGMVIPDNDPNGVNYRFNVSDTNLRVEHVTLGVNINHANRGDLEITLTSPSGMVSRLATPRPYDYGADLDFTFMTVFNWGEDSVGQWTINVSDRSQFFTGVLNGLTLTLYGVPKEQAPDTSTADLGVQVAGAPNPVLIGSTLTYVVGLTNGGFTTASNIVVRQSLPLSTVYVSGSSAAGPVTQVAGLVTWTPTNLASGQSATMTVQVLPVVSGTLYSTVSVTNSTKESDLSNNSFVLSSRVLPLTADLGITMAAMPNPALVGGNLTYSLSVTNRGPSAAAGTIVNVTLPSNVTITSVSSSQGSSSVESNLVTFALGGIDNGGAVALGMTCRPTSPGNLVATARVTCNLPDPVTANNSTSASTAVNPAADLALAFTDYPDPAVLRSNFYYVVAVTNRGPNTASGVTVNQTVPAGVKVVSNFVTQGTSSVVAGGGTVIGSLGTLGVGGSAVMMVTVAGTNAGTFTSVVTVSSSQADADMGNNSATVTTEVALPYVNIVTAGASLKSEASPANGAVDIGEAVTVELRLRNGGNVANTNLVATLLEGSGVTNVVQSPQTYGRLAPGGLPVGRVFGFTAVGTNGGTVNARLRLQDNGVTIGTNVFSFSLPKTAVFTSLLPITVVDNARALPYPANISVSGVTGVLSKATVTLANVSHTYPDDMQVLLAGPGGKKVMLLGNAGGGTPFSGADLTFDDASPAMPDSGNIGTASYHPSVYGTVGSLPAPAPSAPYSTNLSTLNGIVPNGTWSLFVQDVALGDSGVISNGWSLQVYSVSPVNLIADLRVAATASPNPVLVDSPLTYIFVVTNAGPDVANGVVLTNLMTSNVRVISATSDSGTCATNGNAVVCTIPVLPAGAHATVSVTTKPLSAGTITATSSVASAEVDLSTADNVATVSVLAQPPVADLGVIITGPTNAHVVQGSNFTYAITVTNAGTDYTLSGVLTNLLGALGTNDFAVVAVTNTVGAASVTENALVTAALGNLPAGGEAVVTLTVEARSIGIFTNRAWVSSSATDPVAGNDVSDFVLTVVPPAAKIVAAGATLLAESVSPPNGTIESGETVTVLLSMSNQGEAIASNVVATLAATGGISSQSPAQTYGGLAPGASPVARPFTFTATGPGPFVATLLLTNGNVALAPVVFTFAPPTTAAASTATQIQIPEAGTAAPYPSTLGVAGLTGIVSQLTVTLSNLSHTFPDDLDIMLVSPSGTKVILMSDAGGSYSITNVSLTFSDGGPQLPDNSVLHTGTYGPTDYETGDVFVSPAPTGPVSANLASFIGEDPNGKWALYVLDDSAGDRGSLTGWGLHFTLLQPVNPLADLGVTITAQPQDATTWQLATIETRVANAGAAAAPLVLVTNVIPSGLKVVSVAASQGTWTNTPAGLVFALGSLPNGGEALLSVTAEPTAGGAQVVQGAVTGVGSTDLKPGNNVASITVTAVAPPPAPILTAGVDGSTGEFVLTVKGLPGAAYQVLAAASLPGGWSVAGTLTTDSQGTGTWRVPVGSNVQRYYRAAVNP